MKKLFIVILNWKHADDTLECLKSLQSIKLPKKIETTLVVVDNNSGEKDLKKLRSFKSKIEKIVIANKHNYGFTGGNNVGMKYAMNNLADYIIVLNNDTRVDPNFAKHMIKATESDPTVGIVSPKIYFEKNYEFHKDRYKKSELGNVFWYAGGLIDWDNVFGMNNGVDEVDSGQYDDLEELDFATGACFLVTREAILKTGFFDERYFMYMEDVDFSQRVVENELKIIFEPKAKLWHKVAQSSGIGSGLNDYFLARNRMLFGTRYAPARTRFALHREAIKLLFIGREWQKVGIRDFYLKNFNKGSWQN